MTRIHYGAPSDGEWGEHESSVQIYFSLEPIQLFPVDYILFLQKDDVTVVPNPEEVDAIRYVSYDELQALFKG